MQEDQQSKIEQAIEKYLTGNLEQLNDLELFINIFNLQKVIADYLPVTHLLGIISVGISNLMDITKQNLRETKPKALNEKDKKILLDYYKILLFAVATWRDFNKTDIPKETFPEEAELLRNIQNNPDAVKRAMEHYIKKLPKNYKN